jgi:hypothetical protein
MIPCRSIKYRVQRGARRPNGTRRLRNDSQPLLLARCSAIVVVDIMRIKDGVFEEHWDLIQPEATMEESKSKRPMFGDSFPT